jgi:hypothetical protein
MKHRVPTERELTDMIATAFERLPAPDARRLAAIEQRLPERPHLRGNRKIAWWWLVGALVAGAASALWWAVDYGSGEGRREPVPALTSPPVAPSTADQPARSSRSEGAESKPAGEPVQKHGRVIYQREQ